MQANDSKALVQSQPEVLQRRDEQAPNPAAMVQLALEQRADPAVLERLLALQEKWDSMRARSAYTAAMAAFKVTCPAVIAKDKAVSYGQTHYNHATLGAIVSQITEHLSRNGLSNGWVTEQLSTKLNRVLQKIEEMLAASPSLDRELAASLVALMGRIEKLLASGKEMVFVTCTITHSMGHSESVTLSGPLDTSGQKNAIQQLASTVSYLERYTLLAAVGLATADQDNDGIDNGPRFPGDRGQASAPPRQQQAQSRPAAASAPKSEAPAQAGGRAQMASDGQLDAIAELAAHELMPEERRKWLRDSLREPMTSERAAKIIQRTEALIAELEAQQPSEPSTVGNDGQAQDELFDDARR